MEVLLSFPQDQIMFVLFWQQLSTTEFCYGPITPQTLQPKAILSSLPAFALLVYRTVALGKPWNHLYQRTVRERTTSLQETDSKLWRRATGTWGRRKEKCGAKQTTFGTCVHHCHLALTPCTPSPEHSSVICTSNSFAAECSSQPFHVILEQTVKTLVL